MPTRNVNLTVHYDEFIETEITSGHYSSASEVMRAGLTLLEKHKRENELILKELQLRVKKAKKSLNEGKGKHFKSSEEFKTYLKQSKKSLLNK